ncbi:MAG: hypothetical protein AAF998_06110 [Bacteroidota bacterium]
MKKSLFILLVAIAGGTIISAYGGQADEGEPTKVAEAFLKAMQKQKFKKARALCARSSHETFDNYVNNLNPENPYPYGAPYEIGNEKILEDLDMARVYYQQEGTRKIITLNLNEGQWEVDFDKLQMPSFAGIDEDSEEIAETPSQHAQRHRAMREGRAPEQIARAFLDAMIRTDYATAKIYASKSSESALDLTATNPEPTLTGYRITQVRVDEPRATIFYIEDGETAEKELALEQDDLGNWEVFFTKEGSTETPLSDEAQEQKNADEYREYREGLSAETTAANFLGAIARSDFETAQRYASYSSQMPILMLGAAEENSMSGARLQRVEVNGDKAVAYYLEGEETVEKELKLNRDPNGLWQVIMTKDEGAADAVTNPAEQKQRHADKNVAVRRDRSAEEIGTAFLSAFAENDFALAKQYASYESQTSIDMLEMSESNPLKSARISRVVENGETATLYYREFLDSTEKTLSMNRDPNGFWQVILNKDSEGNID